jgi:MarR family transcriptional regulator, lower aerobic nicotinate degradation pathway regulator
MKSTSRLPDRLVALPMYVMLALVREGYRHALGAKLAVRMPEYAVLAILAESGPASQRVVSDRTGFHKSDVTKIINTLEGASLVVRKNDEVDGRRHTVSLTAKGQRQLEASGKELVASMKEFLRGLNSQEYRQLQLLLLKAIQVHDERFAGAAPDCK